MRSSFRFPGQQGFSLPVTLIMMVVMMLLAIMVVRAVDTTNQVANNITFKQAGLAAGDAGVESAIAWLANPPAGVDLTTDQPGLGYYATNLVPTTTNSFIDFTGTVTPTDTSDDVDWWPVATGRPVRAVQAGTVNNNSIAYVIHRLCTVAGAPSSANCLTASSTITEGVAKEAGGVLQITTTSSEAAYRITARTIGPKGTVSYVQAVIMRPYE